MIEASHGGYGIGFEATKFPESLITTRSALSGMGSDSDRDILDLTPVNPNGLTYFGMHLFGLYGCGYNRCHRTRNPLGFGEL